MSVIGLNKFSSYILYICTHWLSVSDMIPECLTLLLFVSQFDGEEQFNISVKTLLSRLPKQRYLKSICEEIYHLKISKRCFSSVFQTCMTFFSGTWKMFGYVFLFVWIQWKSMGSSVVWVCVIFCVTQKKKKPFFIIFGWTIPLGIRFY